MTTLVKMRNPWGSTMEWKGDFSDIDEKYATLSKLCIDGFPNNLFLTILDRSWQNVDRDLRGTWIYGDGEFWLPVDIVRRYFVNLYTCLWSGEYRGDVSTKMEEGMFYIKHGKFTPANSGPVEKPGLYLY